MKILYDTQIFDAQKFGGISRYHYEIIKRLEQNQYQLPIMFTNNEYIKNSSLFTIESDKSGYDSFFPGKSFKGKHKLYNLKKKLFPIPSSNKDEVIKKIVNQDFDVFHPTYYDPYFLDYIGKKPFVITIHDMIYEKYPEFFNDGQITIHNKKILAKKATHIIAISEKTKEDIIDFYNVDEKKITVIYHGSSLHPLKQDFSINFNKTYGKYILFTGSRTLYKNFYFMVEALSDLLIQNNLNIVCTGSSFTNNELDFFEKNNVLDHIFHFYASDDELFELYHQATLFIFPSYYEGFGIPILEAFEAECPIICANASCFPEIAQDAAYYFDPKSKKNLIEIVNKALITNNSKKIMLGKNLLNNYTWEKSAFKHIEVYNKVIEQKVL